MPAVLRRDRLPHECRRRARAHERRASRPPSSTRSSSIVSDVRRGIPDPRRRGSSDERPAADQRPEATRDEQAAVTTRLVDRDRRGRRAARRRRLAGVRDAAAFLTRRRSARRRRQRRSGAAPDERRKIQATLFYVSEDGARARAGEPRGAVRRDARPSRRGTSSRRRSPPRRPALVSAIPAGTTVRAVFLAGTRRSVRRSRAPSRRTAHRAARSTRRCAVYAIVNALTANLADVTAVQILDRRQGSRHARRPRRSAAAARPGPRSGCERHSRRS